MFYGKMKAVTFSYDDGMTQDKRLIEMFDRYGLKGTFNLNSGMMNRDHYPPTGPVRYRIRPHEIKDVYEGHEVAVHTANHPNLTTLDREGILQEVEQDRLALENLVGYPIIGMAYPCGGINNDERVVNILRTETSIQYSRTITSSFAFDLQEDLLSFNPTVHHSQWEEFESLIDQFLSTEPERPMLMYIWGHSYEFDLDNSWGRMEKACEKLAFHNDIFYGTNRQVFGL